MERNIFTTSKHIFHLSDGEEHGVQEVAGVAEEGQAEAQPEGEAQGEVQEGGDQAEGGGAAGGDGSEEVPGREERHQGNGHQEHQALRRQLAVVITFQLAVDCFNDISISLLIVLTF